jgi:hypothetical protein
MLINTELEASVFRRTERTVTWYLANCIVCHVTITRNTKTIRKLKLQWMQYKYLQEKSFALTEKA